MSQPTLNIVQSSRPLNKLVSKVFTHGMCLEFAHIEIN